MIDVRRRPVKVATVTQQPTHGVDSPEGTDRLMAGAEVFLERASRMGADLVAFPECYPQLALGEVFHHAEPTEGGTLERVRESARKKRLYVVWPRAEYDADRGLRNTSILIDRDGEIAGRYDKMFPTVTELADGCIPGTDCPTFQTDFGGVALIICFDMNFSEIHERLVAGKPDLVVFSSMYRGGLQARSLAFELGSFVLTAVRPELGQIIGRCGRVLKESTYETLAVQPINTNSVSLHMDNNWGKMDAMLAKYGQTLTFDYHTREGYYVIESTGEADIDEIVSEFELERARDYLERSRTAGRKAVEEWARKGG